MTEVFDKGEVRKSLEMAKGVELQPFEQAVARMAREDGMIDLNDRDIIAIHRVCNLCDEILRKQFNGKDSGH
jgi:hypothetical protein